MITDDPFESVFAEPESSTHNWPDPIMNFLIAYDIADPKRLREVAKKAELSARRVQKSLFVFTGSRRELDAVLRSVVAEIDPAADRVQAWPIRTSSRSNRVDAGIALPDTGVAVIVSPELCIIIEAIDEPDSDNHEPLII